MISARNAIQEITINAMPTIFLYPVPEINGRINNICSKIRINYMVNYVKKFSKIFKNLVDLLHPKLSFDRCTIGSSATSSGVLQIK